MQQRSIPRTVFFAVALAAWLVVLPKLAMAQGYVPQGYQGYNGSTGYSVLPAPVDTTGRHVVPGAPQAPTQAVRPQSWPSTPVSPGQWSTNNAAAGANYPVQVPTGVPAAQYLTATQPYMPPGVNAQYGVPQYAPQGPGAQAVVSPYASQPQRVLPPGQPNAAQPPWQAPQTQNTVANDPGGLDRTGFKLCEQIVARVGEDEVILLSEVTEGLDQLIEANRGRMADEELERQRQLLIQQRVKSRIDMKLIYYDAKRTIPEERLPDVEKQVSEQFDKSELPRLMKQLKVASRRELDEKLRELGSSLERQRRGFVQQVVAQQWARQQVDQGKEITYDEMLEYYKAHQAEFEHIARVRWEELMVRFSKYRNKSEARQALAAMGNHVWSGAPLAEVAKRQSDGVTAAAGGLHDWTTQGSLVFEEVDRALFTLPVGQLSPIIESSKGCHIIRVVEREPAHITPFTEAQVEIRPKIREQRGKHQLKQYVAKLRESIPVWTAFDDAAGDEQVTSRPQPPRR